MANCADIEVMGEIFSPLIVHNVDAVDSAHIPSRSVEYKRGPLKCVTHIQFQAFYLTSHSFQSVASSSHSSRFKFRMVGIFGVCVFFLFLMRFADIANGARKFTEVETFHSISLSLTQPIWVAHSLSMIK